MTTFVVYLHHQEEHNKLYVVIQLSYLRLCHSKQILRRLNKKGIFLAPFSITDHIIHCMQCSSFFSLVVQKFQFLQSNNISCLYLHLAQTITKYTPYKLMYSSPVLVKRHQKYYSVHNLLHQESWNLCLNVFQNIVHFAKIDQCI